MFSDLIENLDPDTLTKLQQQFLMLDKKTHQKQRLSYFEKGRGCSDLEIYDLWKAMDFENQIEIVTSQDEDLGIDILKYIFSLYNKDSEEKQKDSMSNIQFKLFSSSVINRDKFNTVTAFQLRVWNEMLTLD